MTRTTFLGVPFLLLSLTLDAAAQRAQVPGAGSCDRVVGLPSVSATDDDGATWATNRRALQLGQATFGIAALESGAWLAEFEGTLYRSLSSGCRWSPLAPAPMSQLRLAPGSGDSAVAWGFFAAPQVWRIDASAHAGSVVTPLASLPADVLTVAVDRSNGDHLRAVGRDGGLYDSSDGGGSWSAVGRRAPVTSLVYFAALDPNDLDHAVIGMVVGGAVTTLDGGATWTAARGLSSTGGAVNAFNGVISPASSSVAWVMALDLDENGSGDPSEGRHIYRSIDGGLTFVPVVDHRDGPVVLTNGPVLEAHPTDPDVLYFPFGSRFEGGVWLYRYDDETGATGANFSPDFFQIRSLAIDPLQPDHILAGFEG